MSVEPFVPSEPSPLLVLLADTVVDVGVKQLQPLLADTIMDLIPKERSFNVLPLGSSRPTMANSFAGLKLMEPALNTPSPRPAASIIGGSPPTTHTQLDQTINPKPNSAPGPTALQPRTMSVPWSTQKVNIIPRPKSAGRMKVEEVLTHLGWDSAVYESVKVLFLRCLGSN